MVFRRPSGGDAFWALLFLFLALMAAGGCFFLHGHWCEMFSGGSLVLLLCWSIRVDGGAFFLW